MIVFILYVFLCTCKFVIPRATPFTVIVSHGFISNKSARELSTSVVDFLASLLSVINLLAASFPDPIFAIVLLSSFVSRTQISVIELES